MLPKLRLWVYLWIHYALISSVLAVLFLTGLVLFQILRPTASLTEKTERDLRDAAELVAAALDVGAAEAGIADALIRAMVSQAREEEIEREDLQGISVAWSAVHWQLDRPKLEGYELLVADNDDQELLADRGAALRALAEDAALSGETRRRFERGYLAAAVPVVGAGGVYGSVAYGTSLPPLDLDTAFHFYKNVIPQVLLIFAIAGLFSGGILAYVLGRRITRLRLAAEGFLEGRFGTASIPRGKDEIGALAAVMSKLDASLPELLEDRRKSGMWEERSRVARSLHDTIKQDLFALSLMAEALEKGEGDAERRGALASQVRSCAQGALRKAQELIGAFAPEGFRGDELESAVRSELEKWRVAGSISDYRIAISAPVGDEDAEACFLIAREAIANSARHGRARTVAVDLRIEDGEAILSIRDDGRGPGRGGRPGFGVLLMRERAAELGGTLYFGPGPAGGTAVEARFPPRAEVRP